MSEELAKYEAGVIGPPEEILAGAKRAAQALQGVIAAKKKPVIISGEQYLEFEDWQTVGRFYGITAKVISTAPVQFGDVHGFDARAVVIRASDGMELSAAEAMCLNDEPNWKNRPLFMLRSMAQTRACAKALRNVLAWVVVLAGYRPTPAEEMQGLEHKPPLMEPQKKTEEGKPETQRIKTVILKIEAKEKETEVLTKEGKKEKKISKWFIIHTEGGVAYRTFSESFRKIAEEAKTKMLFAEIDYTVSKYGNEIQEIRIIPDEVDKG